MTQFSNVVEQRFDVTGKLGSGTTPAAAKLDLAQISDITKIIDVDTYERLIYAGNAIATVQSVDKIKVVTVRGTAFDAAGQGGSAALKSDRRGG